MDIGNILSDIKGFLYISPTRLILGYVVYLVFFSIYLEVSPTLRNIWIRRDSTNVIHFRPSGVLLMLLKPFTNIFFWYPSFWDINYYVGGYIFTLILDKFIIRYL